MTQTPNTNDRFNETPLFGRLFLIALLVNTIWINASEIWRYLFVVRPMLHEAFPGQTDVAPFNLPVFGLWTIWDTWLIFAATGFYWLCLSWAGSTIRNSLIAATFFTLTVFGLLWFGLANMGLVSMQFFWTIMPLAWAEQAIAAVLVMWVMNRSKK